MFSLTEAIFEELVMMEASSINYMLFSYACSLIIGVVVKDNFFRPSLAVESHSLKTSNVKSEVSIIVDGFINSLNVALKAY